MISICSKDSFVNSDSILLSFSPFIPLNETPGMTVVFPGLFHRFSACTAAFACSEQANVFPAMLLAGRDFPQDFLFLPLDFLHTVRQTGVPLLPHLILPCKQNSPSALHRSGTGNTAPSQFRPSGTSPILPSVPICIQQHAKNRPAE